MQGIKHILYLFGLKLVMFKTPKGYKGYFLTSKTKLDEVPFFLGQGFKQSLSRLLYKATHRGFISIEEFNKFVGMEWKTQLDIEVWTKMGKMIKKGEKHYFYIPSLEEIEN